MSGHSKWSQIKRQKGANDVRRGATFTKLANAIAISVKQGGGIDDPDMNFRLRLAIDAAKAASMPKDNIERAIARAAGKDAANNIDEVMYEGFVQGGVCVIVEAATDNKNRTTGEVKSTFSKNGGTMGLPGSVSYQFKQIGQIIVTKGIANLDDVFLAAADAGAEDVEDVGEEIVVTTPTTVLGSVQKALVDSGFSVIEAGIIWKPLTLVEFSEGDETAQKVMNILDKLESLDDVQKVYSNFEVV